MKRFVSAFLMMVSLLPVLIGCSNSEIITNNNINPVLVSPSKHIDREVKITAKLLENPNKENNQSVFFVTPDPSNTDLRVKVTTKELKNKLKAGDFVKIEGIISDSEPTISVSKAEKIEPQSVLAPTVKEVVLGEELEQKDYFVILDKIEFAETETRVFVTVKNKRKTEVNFYADYAKVWQEDTELALQKNWEADYQEIPVDIKSEQETYGIIVFEPLDHEKKQAKFLFEGFANDVNLKPFEFKVEW